MLEYLTKAELPSSSRTPREFDVVTFEHLQYQLDLFHKVRAAAIAAVQDAMCGTLDKMIKDRMALTLNREADIVDSMVNELALEVHEKFRFWKCSIPEVNTFRYERRLCRH